MTTVLLVDDDAILLETLSHAFRRRGYDVHTAQSHDAALAQAKEHAPEWVLLDLKIPGTSGLRLIPEFLAIAPFTHIIVLTGYANVATAVEAIKLGAKHYLSKPVGLDEIIAAFQRGDEGDVAMAIGPDESRIARLDVVEWTHIQTVLERNGGNISAAARELNMHRRTLQRKLSKRPPAF